MCRGLILHNLRIETFKFALLSKLEKLRNKHLLLISISGDPPFFPVMMTFSVTAVNFHLGFFSLGFFNLIRRIPVFSFH